MQTSRTQRLMRWIAPLLLVSVLAIALSHPNRSHGVMRAAVDPKGVSYTNYTVEEVPWSIHVIDIDRARTNLELTTTLAHGTSMGLSSLSQQIRRLPPEAGTPLAAINGDFFCLDRETYEGDPRGLQVLRGELVSAPIQRVCLWITPAGNPQMGEVVSKFTVEWSSGDKTPFGLNEERSGNNAVLFSSAMGNTTRTHDGTEFVLERVSKRRWLPLQIGETLPARITAIHRAGNTPIAPNTLVLSLPSWFQPVGAASAAVGDIVMLSTATEPSLKGVTTAIGGGPVLVHHSKADPGRVDKSLVRHPRSAIGWNKEHLFFVEVDGRQRGLSVGMTLPELADFLAVQLRCDEAMNLDGGGSSEVWMNGQIMNSPCFGRERNTANGIVLVEKRSDKP